MKLTRLNISKADGGYTIFFYHKNANEVFAVESDGDMCAPAISDLLGIPDAYRWGMELPKYIKKKLK